MGLLFILTCFVFISCLCFILHQEPYSRSKLAHTKELDLPLCLARSVRSGYFFERPACCVLDFKGITIS